MSSRRRRARSPAVTPLDDDDLLCEFLLRLPPQPSSLPRASAVCKRWHRLISDPGFFRRFRLRHRRNPPLLGFFDRYQGHSFLPTLEAPNRIPPGRFSLQRDDDDFERSMPLGCRHGLFLISLSNSCQVLVWDPITGDKHRIAVPDAFHLENIVGLVNGAVLLSAGEDQHFQVVLVGAVGGEEQAARALACVYSSKTGLWGNLISTPLPYEANGSSRIPTMVYTDDAVLAGGSLHWLLAGNLHGILEFDLVKESLAVIPVPVELGKGFKMMRAEGGGLGCFVVSDYTAQLWKRKTDHDGAASWGLARTIELDMLLSLGSGVIGDLFVLGIAEENNVAFLWTWIGLFMIHLESLWTYLSGNYKMMHDPLFEACKLLTRCFCFPTPFLLWALSNNAESFKFIFMIHLESFKFKKLFNTNVISHYHPFESVYTAEICAGGGHDVAEISPNM